jgi:hypothetical protein
MDITTTTITSATTKTTRNNNNNNNSRNSMPPQISKLASTIFTILLLTTTCSAFVPRNSLGTLKMCPPGGEAFATAWQLTCGMRKKRSAGFIENTENSSSDFPIPSAQTDLIAEDVTQMNPLSRNRRAAESATNQFRPLRLTEMMHFCCRYGCSFRDLLPYCDPFGQWDS